MLINLKSELVGVQLLDDISRPVDITTDNNEVIVFMALFTNVTFQNI
jgi:hypothetical protein